MNTQACFTQRKTPEFLRCTSKRERPVTVEVIRNGYMMNVVIPTHVRRVASSTESMDQGAKDKEGIVLAEHWRI